MKSNEYYRLARLSLKNNKNASNATVRGLAFGFVLIIPVILAVIGIGTSINGYLNKTPYFNYFQLEMADYRIPTQDDISQQNEYKLNLSGSKHLDSLMKVANAKTQIVYEKYVLSYDNQYSFTKDGAEVGSGSMEIDSTKRYNIIDIDKSSGTFPRSLLEKYPDGIFLRGGDFIGNGKREVIVSQKFLEELNMNIDEAYNSYLTIKSNIFPKLDDKLIVEDGESYYLCNAYKIVGIIKSQVAEEFVDEEYANAQLFFTSSNVYDANGVGALKGRMLKGGYVTFDNWNNRALLNKEYMMLGLPTIDTNGGNNLTTLATTTLYTECDSFGGLDSALSYTSEYLNKNFVFIKDTMLTVSYTYTIYKRIFDVSNIAVFAILIVGVVLMLCAIINLVCTIAHSVKERSRYLIMLRAIGANDDIIPKLYLSEILIIIAKVSACILTIGLAVSIALKYLLAMVINNAGITIPISIPWWSIALSIVLSIGLFASIGALIAYAMTRKLSKASIIEILNGGV